MRFAGSDPRLLTRKIRYMELRNAIFASDFSETPYWWRDFSPPEDVPDVLPGETEVLVVGSGYAGVSCALTLAKHGIDVLVLDAQRLGSGASTRSGGQITGGVNVGKNPTGKSSFEMDEAHARRREAMLRECAEGMRYVEQLIDEHGIACEYKRTGRVTGFWVPSHRDKWADSIDDLNRFTDAGAKLLTRSEISDEVATDSYYGGVLIERAGHLQPALYYRGVLGAARANGAKVFGMTAVQSVERSGAAFVVKTARGNVRAKHVVLATNGYPSSIIGDLRRRVVPVTSHIIATEPLPEALRNTLIQRDRAVVETRRVTCYYRMSPDGTRLVYGGRARFVHTDARTTAQLLHRQMLRRFPQLADTKVSHSWEGNVAMTFDFLPHVGEYEGMHYAMGCNGSGVVMMTHLGNLIAQKIIHGRDAPQSAYDTAQMPTHPLYYGKPWFMSALGSWYQFRDALDRQQAEKMEEV